MPKIIALAALALLLPLGVVQNARADDAPEFENRRGEQKSEDPLLLFAFDGEPSRSETHKWTQEPPEVGTFLFQWTYTYKGEDYTASVELDVGFISKDSKTYLKLIQRGYKTWEKDTNWEKDTIDIIYPVPEIRPPDGVYAAFLNRTGLHFRFNPKNNGAVHFSRFRNIRITRVDYERLEEGN